MNDSLKIKPGCHTLSKALLTSRRAAVVYRCLLVESTRLVITRTSCSVVECCLLKPNCSSRMTSDRKGEMNVRRRRSKTLERMGKSEIGLWFSGSVGDFLGLGIRITFALFQQEGK